MINIIYDKKLNSFARKYLIKGNENLVTSPRDFASEYTSNITRIGELFLYYNGVSFSVYGENIPLSILVNTFGVSGVEQLLEQKALEFVLDNTMVTYLVDDIPGINPLQSGITTSNPHNDPEESATLGLQWMSKQLPRRERRSLIKKVVKAYKVPPSKVAEDATVFGHQGYESNLFECFGLPKEKELNCLAKDERAKLCSLATQCMELAILSSLQYDSLDCYEITRLAQLEYDRLNNAKTIRDYTDSLFSVENLPNFQELINKGVINLKQIPELRNSRNAKKFRKWIVTVSKSTDSSELTKEYLDSIVHTKGILETATGKFFKTIAVTALSGAVGAAIAGPGGLLVGTIAGKIAEPAVDVGLSLLDTYLIDGISRGWNPRNYFDKEIRPLTGK